MVMIYINDNRDSIGVKVNLFNNNFSNFANQCVLPGCTPKLSQGGNINADPLFVNPGSGDFHLQNGSPCNNAGNNAAPKLSTTDFEGNQRIAGSAPDIGAVEVVLVSASSPSSDSSPAFIPLYLLILLVPIFIVIRKIRKFYKR